MNSVVKILMKRDGLTKEQAMASVKSFLEEASDLVECGDYDSLEELFMDEFGLEPDYLPELLGLY